MEPNGVCLGVVVNIFGCTIGLSSYIKNLCSLCVKIFIIIVRLKPLAREASFADVGLASATCAVIDAPCKRGIIPHTIIPSHRQTDYRPTPDRLRFCHRRKVIIWSFCCWSGVGPCRFEYTCLDLYQIKSKAHLKRAFNDTCTAVFVFLLFIIVVNDAIEMTLGVQQVGL